MRNICVWLAFGIWLVILELNSAFELPPISTEDRIKAYGYDAENHTVTTPDGFSITIVRLVDATDTQTPRPVVLMMHGLTSSSDGWIFGGPTNASAFYLFNNGYDVWLGNSRGNPYGRTHTTLNPDDRAFWRFSWNEIGLIDLPAIFDYILGVTGQPSLHYVGHSQGTSILLVLLTSKPEYGQKVKTSHLLAPIAFMKNARSNLLIAAQPTLGTYTALDPLVGDRDFLKYLRESYTFDKCADPSRDLELCTAILFEIYGGRSDYFNRTIVPEIYSSHPASCSTHQAIHLVQLRQSGKFRKYDFGILNNLALYNQLSPPDYPLANIQTDRPLNLYYSAYDELSSNLDVEKLILVMGNKVDPHFIDLEHFAHIDFLTAYNSIEVLYQGILQRMNAAEV